MGLDCYLDKVKKSNFTIRKVYCVNSYFGMLEHKKEHPDYTGNLKDWCGCLEEDFPTKECIDFYAPYYIKRYDTWDTQKEFGHMSIFEEVGYWRKANQIHNWFVQNVQNGEDNCGSYEVSKEQLETLLDICKQIKNSCELENGTVVNGYIGSKDGLVPNYQDGKVMVNTSVAKELLPTTSGCFFGGMDYDEYYMYHIDETIDIISTVLENTDFEKETILYSSSW